MAQRLSRGETAFDYLDAAQLLKHTLGIRRKYPNGQLIFLWFDPNKPEGASLGREIALFSECIDPALKFRAVTYQQVFASLRQEPLAKREHVDYLSSRYFAA